MLLKNCGRLQYIRIPERSHRQTVTVLLFYPNLRASVKGKLLRGSIYGLHLAVRREFDAFVVCGYALFRNFMEFTNVLKLLLRNRISVLAL